MAHGVCVCVSVREWQLAECRRQGLSLVSHDSLMKSSGRVGTEGGGQKRGMWGHKGRERHCGGRMGQRFLHQKRKNKAGERVNVRREAVTRGLVVCAVAH